MGAVGFIYLSGLFRPSISVSAIPPTSTVISIEQISLTPATPTPFQPVPTDTPTPTATLTPTPTATETPLPTNTPVPPTNTSIPWPTNTYIAPTQAPDDGFPASAIITNISGSYQTHNLSCESRAAATWAGYFGVSISEDSFLYQLPSSDDPDTGFVGSADGVWGQIPPHDYGVHADPVASLLRQYGLAATAVHGYSYDQLRQQLVNGKPVIVWVYGQVWYGGSPVSYTASNGHTSKVVAYEHTVIVTGYNSQYVYILDGASKYYSTISQFKSSWAVLGNMAVIAQ